MAKRDKTHNWLERIYSWFLGHRIVGPALAIIVVIGTTIIFTGNVADSFSTLHSLLGRTKQDESPADQADGEASDLAESTSEASSCQIIVVNPVFDVGFTGALDTKAENAIVRFDGFEIGPRAQRNTMPFSLVISDYPPGTYEMAIKYDEYNSLSFYGTVTLTGADFYLLDPEITVYDNFNDTEPITLQPISRRDASLAMGRYRRELPSCDRRPIGISWGNEKEIDPAIR